MKDYVKCNNCEETLLVDIGSDICPKCSFDGSLQWVDENLKEVEDDFIIGSK